MQGRIITNQQYEQLQGVFVDDDTFFNFVPDINGIYFLILDEQGEIEILNSQYAYLLEIPLSPYIPPPGPPFPPIN